LTELLFLDLSVVTEDKNVLFGITFEPRGLWRGGGAGGGTKSIKRWKNRLRGVKVSLGFKEKILTNIFYKKLCKVVALV
jgi:hypothetical protein